MTTAYLRNLIQRAIWRLNMTWHYILAVLVVLAIFVITGDLSLKFSLFSLLLVIAGFMLLDVPLESKQWKTKSQKKSRRGVSKKELQSIYKDLIESLPDPVIILNRDNQLLFSNKPARSFFNIGRKGQDISAIIRSPEFLDALATVAKTRKEKEIHLLERVPIERQYTVRFSWIESQSKSIAANTLNRPAIIVHFHDLTEQERLNRMRTDFVANASHELRTPLASLLGFIDTLQGAARDDPAARERFLAVMAGQGRRMTDLIDDLLSLSRIEMKAHRRPNQKVDIIPLLNNTIDILRPLSETQNIEIRLTPPEGKIGTIGNRDELAQVFQNLINNAIKYGKKENQPSATIEINARIGAEHDLNQSQIAIEVKDEGIGIDPVHIPRLTERFYRVDIQQSKARGGTGLGLAITKHIITNHRGELKIRSRLGEGSTFTVILPRADI